jgi:uncharacterized membrane protein YfcA
MESLVIYLAAGLATGLVSGLFGVGGGLTVVPALVLALPFEDVPARYVMHMAIGTSLAVMVFTAAVTTVWRHIRGDLAWPVLWKLAGLVVIGGLVGAAIGDMLPGAVLRWLFVGFVLLTILRELWRHWLRPAAAPARGRPVRATSKVAADRLSFILHGVAAGVVGALLGVGAAVVIVPFLIHRGHRIQTASALSAGLSAIIGLAAGAGYILGGLNEQHLPESALGYLYLPAFFGVAIGALAGSPLGVALSHRLSDGLQRALFALYLCLVLAVMVAREQF